MVFTFALTGCGAVENVEQKAGFSVGAVPLDTKTLNTEWGDFSRSLPPFASQQPVNLTPSVSSNPTPVFGKKDYLGFVASRSQDKCADFLTSLVVASNATHLGLDMIGTVFSALGTAFTPLATVHALTAGATIAGGWRTAIDADIYAKLAVQNLVQAIQSTYYKDMGSYVDALAKQYDSDLTVTAELTKIQTIHGECTLASAEGSITASLKPGAQTAATTANAVLTIAVSGTNSAAQPDTLELTAQSKLANIPPVDLRVNIGDSAAKIATALASNVSQILKNFNISANLTGPSTITLTSQPSDMVKWSATMANSAKSGVTVNLTQVAQPLPTATQAGQPGKAAQP
jgi:hypothetical protein